MAKVRLILDTRISSKNAISELFPIALSAKNGQGEPPSADKSEHSINYC